MSKTMARPTHGSVLRGSGPLARILEYTPRRFELGVPGPAMEFQELRQQNQNDFRMAEATRIQTGVDKMDERVIEAEVENKTLEKLKEVQETAYKEAFALGLQEGRQEAFQKATAEIERDLTDFRNLIEGIQHLKEELFKHNESHLLRLALQGAARLAHREVTVDNDCLVEIMRQAVLDAQIQEEISVQVSPSQIQFLETLKVEAHQEFDFLKNVKLVPSETVQPGGCIIETNYGVIDAQIEERIGRFWDTMTENLYRVKERIGAA